MTRTILLTLALVLLPWTVRAITIERMADVNLPDTINIITHKLTVDGIPAPVDTVKYTPGRWITRNDSVMFVEDRRQVTAIEIFHGPTRQAVRDYVNTWLDSTQVEVVSVDMCFREIDSVAKVYLGKVFDYYRVHTSDTSSVITYNTHPRYCYNDAGIYDESLPVDTVYVDKYDDKEITGTEYIIMVCYREWREK